MTYKATDLVHILSTKMPYGSFFGLDKSLKNQLGKKEGLRKKTLSQSWFGAFYTVQFISLLGSI